MNKEIINDLVLIIGWLVVLVKITTKIWLILMKTLTLSEVCKKTMIKPGLIKINKLWKIGKLFEHLVADLILIQNYIRISLWCKSTVFKSSRDSSIQCNKDPYKTMYPPPSFMEEKDFNDQDCILKWALQKNWHLADIYQRNNYTISLAHRITCREKNLKPDKVSSVRWYSGSE